MALTSLQVCMDDWLQGSINEDNGMDSSSPSSGDILTCSRPLMERRLRPPQDQALKCPRCDSAHTKFCYYNNYSLSQPRYFCKTCRRYWTKGGTLRNIPVGGGCRKNKKLSNSKKSSPENNPNTSVISHVIPGPTTSPDLQFSYLNSLLGGTHGDGTYSSHNFMGNGDHLGIMSNGVMNDHFQSTFIPTPYGMSLDGNTSNYNYGARALMENCQRLMLPNYEENEDLGCGGVEVKPDTKLLAVDNHHSFGYLNAGLGSWNAGLVNGYGSSATNPLV